MAERGVLFSSKGESPLEYRRSFIFANAVRSSFWDKDDANSGTMSRKEAKFCDLFMEVITERFF